MLGGGKEIMKTLKLLNGNELDNLIYQVKINNLPIFAEDGHFVKEVLGKWKAIFGFSHDDDRD